MNLSNFIKPSALFPVIASTLFYVFCFSNTPAFSQTVKKAKKQASYQMVSNPEAEQADALIPSTDLISIEKSSLPNDAGASKKLIANQVQDSRPDYQDNPKPQKIQESKDTQEKKAKQDNKDTPGSSFNVSSDQMIAQRNNTTVEFSGNVKVTRLDSILTADSVIVYFDENTEDSGSEVQANVKKIVSSGDVEYVMDERQAFADKAVYTAADEVLILTGTPAKLQTGGSFVTGQKITLYRTEGRVLVESMGSNRVHALFNPEDAPAE